MWRSCASGACVGPTVGMLAAAVQQPGFPTAPAGCPLCRYAILYDRPQLACHLLRRGAAATRDRHGLTAAQLAAGRDCTRDPDLAALLARHQQ